jgi:serine/threonine protein kinase
LRISKKVRNIGGYVRFFAPVLKSCEVKITKDRVKDLKKCEVFEKDSEKKLEGSTYISMKTRYVGDKDLRAYIFSNLNSDAFLHELWRTHAHILKGIQRLFKNKIVHYDLKYNNIIFDDDRNEPIIIDFGQSWIIDDLKTEEQLLAAFFVFDQYDYWCIDILVCNYILQKVGYSNAKTEMVTEQEIDYIYDVFIYGREPKYESTSENIKKVVSDVYLYNILQNPSKMTNFKILFKEYAKEFINKRTWWELYEELIKYANNWDCYSVSIIYLNMLDDVFLSNPESYRKLLIDSNMRLPKYVELMESIVYSAPNKRPHIQTVLSEIELLLRKTNLLH